MDTEGYKTPEGEQDSGGGEGSDRGARRPGGFFPFIVTFLMMLCVWVILSGKFDPFHLSLGIVSCAIVAYLSSGLLFPSMRTRGFLVQLGVWIWYLPWLIREIIKANLHVTYLVFHPRMMDLIDPQIVKFRSKLISDVSLVTLANSITLTPGTITVNVSPDGDFKVHAIDKASAEPLPGEMEARIAKTFGEL